MGGLHEFVRLAWPHVEGATPFVDGWHLRVVCGHLERISAGGCPKSILNLPPASCKSLLAEVFWPAWDWIRNPGRRWIFVSYEKGLSDLSARRFRRLVTSDWYTRTFGDRVSLPATTVLDEIQNDQGGIRISTSTGAKLTGLHADVLVFDDPQSANTVDSPHELESTATWCRRVASTRLRDQVTGARLLVQQRLHPDDLTGRLLREDSGWEHLWLAMELDPTLRHPADPRTEDGQLLWPRRAPAAVVARLRKELREDAPAQLGQNPVSREGAMLRHPLRLSRAWS